MALAAWTLAASSGLVRIMARFNYAYAPGIPPLCQVHRKPRPCPDNGEPALPLPIHILACEEHRVEHIEVAGRMVGG